MEAEIWGATFRNPYRESADKADKADETDDAKGDRLHRLNRLTAREINP